tara:strand:- start:116 stop:361 length:246 start_codon:yes stop_codon:yes gene_type:complete
MTLKTGDLVYLPSEIMIFGSFDDSGMIRNWVNLDKPSYGLVIEANWGGENIYHKVYTKGSNWFVRTIDAFRSYEKENKRND